MSSLTKALQEEISRIAKKEVKSQLTALTAELKELKSENNLLKRQINALEKMRVPVAGRRGPGRPPTRKPAPIPSGPRVRITAKGIRSLRSRLKLTQEEFGQLLGVTGQSVWKLESSEGALRLRNATREKYLATRELKTAREAQDALEKIK